jgi:hypothetical protein
MIRVRQVVLYGRGVAALGLTPRGAIPYLYVVEPSHQRGADPAIPGPAVAQHRLPAARPCPA